MILKRVAAYGPYVLLGTLALAVLSMLFHALAYTRQPDVQSIEYAFKLIKSVYEGTPGDYLLYPKKYPLMSVLPLSVLYTVVLTVLRFTGKIPSFSQSDIEGYVFTGPVEIHFVTRLVTVLSGVLLLWLVHRVSKKLNPTINPMHSVVLLLSSMLVLTFFTSMRQHLAEVSLTFLTFYFSLNLAESKTRKNELLAFGSATLAFCVLQNGIFSLIFPLTAYLTHENRIELKRLLRPGIYAYAVGFFFLSSVFGYTFLWKELALDHHLGFGLGNEDIGESPWGTTGFVVMLRTLFGSETFLTLFALCGMYQWTKKRSLKPMYLALAVYFIAYAIFFGLVGWTTARYFFPFVPFLAIIGAPVFAQLRFIRIPFCIFVALLHLKFTYLGVLPDTYDLTRAFVLSQQSKTVSTNIAHYYLGIPPTKASIVKPAMEKERYILTLETDMPDARPFIPYDQKETSDLIVSAQPLEVVPDSHTLCYTALASPISGSMFLWSEVDWGVYWIFRTSHLGPNITVYCKN